MGGGPGTGERVRWGVWEGVPSRSYAVSAPADQDASQLYYSYRIIKGGGGGGGGGGAGVLRWVGERAIYKPVRNWQESIFSSTIIFTFHFGVLWNSPIFDFFHSL